MSYSKLCFLELPPFGENYLSRYDFNRGITLMHVYSLIVLSDLNQGQIYLHYNCMVYVTGNPVK